MNWNPILVIVSGILIILVVGFFLWSNYKTNKDLQADSEKLTMLLEKAEDKMESPTHRINMVELNDFLVEVKISLKYIQMTYPKKKQTKEYEAKVAKLESFVVALKKKRAEDAERALQD